VKVLVAAVREPAKAAAFGETAPVVAVVRELAVDVPAAVPGLVAVKDAGAVASRVETVPVGAKVAAVAARTPALLILLSRV
jgi:hypothetical protein